MNLKKFSLYNIFHSKRDDLPDIEQEDTTPTLGRFFKLLGRKFWKLISLDLLMLPLLLPTLIAIFLYIGIDKTPSANNALFSQLYGAVLIDQSPEAVFLLDLFGSQFLIPAYHSTGTYVGIGICIAFLIITFGWQNVGSTYILRSLVRGDPVFLFSDYFYAIKRNFKQGFLLGLLDFICCFLLIYDFMVLWETQAGLWYDIMFGAILAISILYFFMRFYIYHLQITFNLSIRKILKNALIFTALGIKRNLMALLGILLLTAITIAIIALLLMVFGYGGIGVMLILIPFYFLSFTSFMTSYAAYPIIDRYMIAPYIGDEEENLSEETTEDEEAEASSSDAE